MIEKAIRYIEYLFAGDSSGHDAAHTLRVFRLSERIAEAEGADLQTVRLAALLHDADDRKLSPETAAGKLRARAFLESQGLEEARILNILKIIDEVSFRGTDSVVPDSIEGKCVQDADRLDAMGAIGIGRAFAFGGSRGRSMYDAADAPGEMPEGKEYETRGGSTVAHFYEKLLHLQSMLNTETAKEMGAHRHRYMEAFLEEFLEEWEGHR